MKVPCVLSMVLLCGAACALAQAPAAQQTIPGPISPPKLLTDEPPKVAACAGITPAEVKLQFKVTAQGTTRDIKVLASPSDKHSACATALVSAYNYLPAMRDGLAVDVQIILTLNVKP